MLRMQRATIQPAIREAAANSASQIFGESELFKNALNIACYQAQGSELTVEPIIKLVLKSNKKCYLPALPSTEEHKLHFLLFSEKDSLVQNRYGILEPTLSLEKEISPEKLDVVLVPLVGFDSDGYRLGSGSGYYDRAFAFLLNKPRPVTPFFIGVGYQIQQVDCLPHDEWDVKLSGVLTENDLILFK